MNPERPQDPAKVLATVRDLLEDALRSLGGDIDGLAGKEDLETLRDSAVELGVDELEALQHRIREAVEEDASTVRLTDELEGLRTASPGVTIELVEPSLVLRSGAPPSVDDLRFFAVAELPADPQAVVRVEKAEVIAAALGDGIDGTNHHGFLYPEALDRFVAQPVSHLRALWPGSGAGAPVNCETAYVHCAGVAWKWSGALLRIGAGLSIEPTPAAASGQARRFQQLLARIPLSGIDLHGLTPAHLALVDGVHYAAEGAPLAQHLATLSLLHACDLAVGTDSGARIDFRGSSFNATIESPLKPSGSDAPYPHDLVATVDWIYRPPGDSGAVDQFQDRLAVAQTVVARNLESVAPDERRDRLVSGDAAIHAGTSAMWKSYIGDKIDAHAEKRLELEGHLTSAIADFGSRAESLASDLTTAVVGAVGVLIGSFLGAVFGSSFNGTIFRIGVLTYAGYLLVYPGVTGLLTAWTRQRASEDDFGDRLASYGHVLGPAVDEVLPPSTQDEPNKIDKAKKRFRNTFGFAIGSYLVVIALSIVAAACVPDLIESDCPEATEYADDPDLEPPKGCEKPDPD